MDEEVEDDFLRKVLGYPKDVKQWEVVVNLKSQLEMFRQTLPLIKLLKDPFIRERHWEKISKQLGSNIDPQAEDFTLGSVFKLNLGQYAESVREICEVAKEEYKIESALEKIEKKWENLNLEMEPHKKTYKIKRADEIFSVLEDHMATLSNQKTTLFYESFKSVIEKWENALTQVLETIELLLAV